MQIFIAVGDPPQVNPEKPNEYAGLYHVVKHYTVYGGKMRADRLHLHCFGTAMRVDYGNHCRIGSAALQHMFGQLHGLQISCFDVGPRSVSKAVTSSDQASRMAGYRHIRDKGPRSNNQNQFMEWADGESHGDKSPVYGWPEVKIVTSLSNYAKGATECEGADILAIYFAESRSLVPERCAFENVREPPPAFDCVGWEDESGQERCVQDCCNGAGRL